MIHSPECELPSISSAEPVPRGCKRPDTGCDRRRVPVRPSAEL